MKFTQRRALYALCAMFIAGQTMPTKANPLIIAAPYVVAAAIGGLAYKLGEFTEQASGKIDELTGEVAEIQATIKEFNIDHKKTNLELAELNAGIKEFNANHLATNNTFNDPGMVGGMAVVLVATSFIAYGVKSAADEQFFNNSWDPRQWQWYEKTDSGEEKLHNGVISMGIGGAGLMAGITALAVRGAYLAGRAAQKV